MPPPKVFIFNSQISNIILKWQPWCCIFWPANRCFPCCLPVKIILLGILTEVNLPLHISWSSKIGLIEVLYICSKICPKKQKCQKAVRCYSNKQDLNQGPQVEIFCSTIWAIQMYQKTRVNIIFGIFFLMLPLVSIICCCVVKKERNIFDLFTIFTCCGILHCRFN